MTELGIDKQSAPPTRLVIDAVGFVRALINPFSAWGAIIHEETRKYTLIMSDDLEAEIHDVLERPFLREKYQHISESMIAAVHTMLEDAERVDLVDIPAICRDPNDDMVLATAVQGTASFLASEDNDLLDVGVYQGIRIVNGPTMLRILRS